MSVDTNIILYNLAKQFHSTFNTVICKRSTKMIQLCDPKFYKMSDEKRIFYVTYAAKMAKVLRETYEGILLFELNANDEHEICHDFRLCCSSNEIIHVSLNHKTVVTHALIPTKIMKTCGYRRGSKVHKQYTWDYNKLTRRAYSKIKQYEKYSDIPDNTKSTYLLNPVADLVMETLQNKRKCAPLLYNALYQDGKRVVFKLYKSRFTMYDLTRRLKDVTSFRIRVDEDTPNIVELKFNNGVGLNLVLRTNVNSITDHISLKFHTKFVNFDKLFKVESVKV